MQNKKPLEKILHVGRLTSLALVCFLNFEMKKEKRKISSSNYLIYSIFNIYIYIQMSVFHPINSLRYYQLASVSPGT